MILSDSIPIPEAKTWLRPDRNQRSICMQSDEQLAQSAQRGSHQSLQNLIERHHAPLFGFLYRLSGGDRMLAEDLVQEAFLHALRGISSYRYPRPFKPWLYAIALNCYRDRYRRREFRQNMETIDDPQVEYAVTDPGPSPEESQEKQEDLEGCWLPCASCRCPNARRCCCVTARGSRWRRSPRVLESRWGRSNRASALDCSASGINLEERR